MDLISEILEQKGGSLISALVSTLLACRWVP